MTFARRGADRGSDYFDFVPRPPPAKAVLGGQRAGKTALQWHQLTAASAATGRPIECVRCSRPYRAPPPLGRCVCGGYVFGIQLATAAQPGLPLEEGPPRG